MRLYNKYKPLGLHSKLWNTLELQASTTAPRYDFITPFTKLYQWLGCRLATSALPDLSLLRTNLI